MKKPGKNTSESIERITIRLDKTLASYYRKLANTKGKSVAEFIRESMMQGVIADNAYDFEKRMQTALTNMQNMVACKNLFIISKSGMKSIYVCENILSKIIGDRNMQDLYDAQNRAIGRITQEMENDDDE